MKGSFESLSRGIFFDLLFDVWRKKHKQNRVKSAFVGNTINKNPRSRGQPKRHKATVHSVENVNEKR